MKKISISKEVEEDLEGKEFNENNELIEEFTEERGGCVYLRYRDKKGRFVSEVKDPDREEWLKADRKIDKFLKDYRKKIDLPYNVKILLLRLVDDFRNREAYIKDGFYIPSVSHFKRIPYHEVLMCHKMKRSAFSQFISRMVKQGLIVKIRHGKKPYLRITKKGLDKVWAFHEEYLGETWRMP